MQCFPEFVANPQTSRRPHACTRQSSAAGEPMVGRAGMTHLWVLIEHPGPWPASAPDDVLPDALTEKIYAAQGRIRLVVIRRPRIRRVLTPTCVLAWTDGTRHWMREGSVDRYEDLSALPFESMATGVEPAFGCSRTEPLFGVCTHGKKDACCAELGRPVVAALDAAQIADVWECSHIGGDRFAANMIAWPAAVYFSRLDGNSAIDAAEKYLNGELSMTHLRGRAALSQAAQAAEHAVRRATDIVATDALESVTERVDGVRTTVDLRLGARDFRVVVCPGAPGQPFRHDCGSGGTVEWNGWIIEHLHEQSH
ncbi:MAG: sucrase ferredoxin [Rhodococcus sp. (in: high G+C Gram-positive bacteria)]|uniref:sucrase ferredoxin n=1 Tax=Rhodococcus sp. TaxID=1831 RepID=UPI002AD99B88|nr:sucrase ferredoxin [Rhodococcus sp. (in: high G+C Gram-positive bacteria)]